MNLSLGNLIGCRKGGLKRHFLIFVVIFSLIAFIYAYAASYTLTPPQTFNTTVVPGGTNITLNTTVTAISTTPIFRVDITKPESVESMTCPVYLPDRWGCTMLNSDTITFNVSQAGMELYLGGPLGGTAPFSINVTASSLSGNYTFNLTTYENKSGINANSSLINMTVDAAVPYVLSVSSDNQTYNPPLFSAGQQVEITFNESVTQPNVDLNFSGVTNPCGPGWFSVLAWSFSGKTVSNCSDATDETWCFNWTGTCGEGLVTINITSSEDQACNALVPDLSHTFVHDGWPPRIDILDPSDNSIYNGGPIVLNLNVTDISTITNVSWRLRNSSNIAAEGSYSNSTISGNLTNWIPLSHIGGVNWSSTINFSVLGLAEGNYTIELNATDIAGNNATGIAWPWGHAGITGELSILNVTFDKKPTHVFTVLSASKLTNTSNLTINVKFRDAGGLVTVQRAIQNSSGAIVRNFEDLNTSTLVSGSVLEKTENLSGLVSGTYFIIVNATDILGQNNSLNSANFTITTTEATEGCAINNTLLLNSTVSNNVNFNPTAETQVNLTINVSANITNSSISVSQYNSNSNSGLAVVTPLGKYVEISPSAEIAAAVSAAIIKVNYTDEEVSSAGISESSLRLYYYNESSGTWTPYDSPNGGVDTAANYVWAITAHFSTWGIFGSPPPSPPSSSSSSSSSGGGGGGFFSNWTCTPWSECSKEGIQTRECTNSIPYITIGKPATEQSCTYSQPSEETSEGKQEASDEKTLLGSEGEALVQGMEPNEDAASPKERSGKSLFAFAFIILAFAILLVKAKSEKKKNKKY